MKKLIFLLKIFLIIWFSQAISLPFSSDMWNKYSITEGFYYSQAEQQIHGQKYHWWIDYSLPYGSPIYSPVDWYILASYHDEMLNKFFWSQQIHYGWWRHVVIFSPEDEKIVLIAHMSSIEKSIPIDFPTARLNKNMKVIKYVSNIANMSKSSLLEKFWNFWAKKIKKWDFIWTVGTSGLGLWEKFVDPYNVPYYPEVFYEKSWDEPHIHMEVYYKNNIFSKKNKIDPYGIYKNMDSYQRYFWVKDWTIFDYSGSSIQFAKYTPFYWENNKKLLLEKLKNRKN